MQWSQHFPYADVLVFHAGSKYMLDDPSDDVHIGSQAVNYNDSQVPDPPTPPSEAWRTA